MASGAPSDKVDWVLFRRGYSTIGPILEKVKSGVDSRFVGLPSDKLEWVLSPRGYGAMVPVLEEVKSPAVLRAVKKQKRGVVDLAVANT